MGWEGGAGRKMVNIFKDDIWPSSLNAFSPLCPLNPPCAKISHGGIHINCTARCVVKIATFLPRLIDQCSAVYNHPGSLHSYVTNPIYIDWSTTLLRGKLWSPVIWKREEITEGVSLVPTPSYMKSCENEKKLQRGVSLVPSHMKSYKNEKKTIWFDSFLMTCFLWTILLVFIWPTHFLRLLMAFTHWNRKLLPVFYMTSQVINFSKVNKVEI